MDYLFVLLTKLHVKMYKYLLITRKDWFILSIGIIHFKIRYLKNYKTASHPTFYVSRSPCTGQPFVDLKS